MALKLRPLLLLAIFSAIIKTNLFIKIGEYQLAKQGNQILINLNDKLDSCKGQTIWILNLVSCAVLCSNPDTGPFDDQYGACAWFVFDENAETCTLCFPYSSLPVLLSFSSVYSSVIYSSRVFIGGTYPNK